MKKMIRFFDAFAGIGGARQGLEKTGEFQCMGYCEVDKFAVQSYRTIFDIRQPDEQVHQQEEYYENIKTIDTAKQSQLRLALRF